MEKTSYNLVNFLDIPTEIQQHIADYLDAATLSFFAQSHKQVLKNLLPLLLRNQPQFPMLATTKWISTYLYQAHQLFVCGANCYWQLVWEGIEHGCTNFTTVPWPKERGRIQQVVAGGYHTLVLTEGNRLWGWGWNEYGQLGKLGKQEDDTHTFPAMPWPEDRGKIQQVTASMFDTLVLTEDNQLWVCGVNSSGQLGLGDNKQRDTFTAVPWPKERGRIHQVIAGESHTVVFTQDKQLWVCGDNRYGQLGLGGGPEDRATFIAVPWPKNRSRIHQVVAGGAHTVVLTQDNKLWMCGDNKFGQLGLGNYKQHATFSVVRWPQNRGWIHQVVAGGAHTVVLTQDNQLWVCGFNQYGQLGLGDNKQRDTFTAVPWPKERGRIHQVIAGDEHTVVFTQDKQLWVCGGNHGGQLGLRDKESRSNFTLVKALPKAMQQALALNNRWNQLIKLGTSLIQTPSKKSLFFHSQHERDEPEDQPPLKKMRL